MPAELGVLVVDEDGTKLPGATVSLGIFDATGKALQQTTNIFGLAQFEKLAAGTYTVAVTHPRFPLAARSVTVWNNSSQQITITLIPIRHIYFAIFYQVKDGAFRRAAETWEREIRGMSSFNSRTDKVLMLEQLTEGQFNKAWNLVYQEGNLPGRVVMEGHLFTHASYDSDSDGLEFKKDESGGTLDQKEMKALVKLNWKDDGKLVLHGCNTGKSERRYWAPAQELSNGQGIRVEGLTGYGYFSKKRDVYAEIDKNSTTVYLYSYKRGWNAFAGDGSKMPEVFYTPEISRSRGASL
jgi:hypothetical protein